MNIILTVFTTLSADNLSSLLMTETFAVVVYNTQIVPIIEMEYICADDLLWSEWYVVVDDLFHWLHLLKFKTCSTVLYVVFYISIYAGPVN